MTIKYTWSNTSPWRQNKFLRRYIALNVRSQKLNSVYNYSGCLVNTTTCGLSGNNPMPKMNK